LAVIKFMDLSIFKKQEIRERSKSGDSRIAILILTVGLVLTLIATIMLKEENTLVNKTQFELVSREIRTRIERRLNSHALLLRSGASFFVASDTVSRNEWKLYIEHTLLEKTLPGIEGVGYTVIIKKENLQSHIQKVRSEGFPDYNVTPKGERDIYTSILYIEPFSGRNLRAFGYDMFSEPVRRKAMEQARDKDVAALSGKVILVQESVKDQQPGALMYVPVYRNGMPVRTVEERRKAIIGWVYSPYRMIDLMNGMLGRWDSTEYNRIHLRIYDQNNMDENSLLFDSEALNPHVDKDRNTISYTIPLNFNGHVWILNFTQYEGSESYYSNSVIIIFISGILISFLLFALFIAFTKARSRLYISERLSEQLKESEEKHRALIENATEGIYVVQNDRIAFANKACEAITGIPFNEMIGLPLNEFLNIDESESKTTRKNEVGDQTYVLNSEISIKNKLGESRWLLINSAQIMWGGENATLNLTTDVTQLKKAENIISRKNKELENLNATKDKFFSIIAHDLSSPFNSLLGLTEILSVDLPNMSREEIQHLVDIIYKSSKNLFRLLQNLLQWSQIQSGTIPFNPKQILIQPILDENIEIANESAVLKDIKLETSVDLQLEAFADVNMLQTVVRNLISNAVKFTPKGGKVSILARKDKEDKVLISVEDTGIGISPVMINDIFRIDVKTNRVGTASEPSNGLGLLLCKEFVEIHGGKIWVESTVGKGSVFHFTIPSQSDSQLLTI